VTRVYELPPAAAARFLARIAERAEREPPLQVRVDARRDADADAYIQKGKYAELRSEVDRLNRAALAGGSRPTDVEKSDAPGARGELGRDAAARPAAPAAATADPAPPAVLEARKSVSGPPGGGVGGRDAHGESFARGGSGAKAAGEAAPAASVPTGGVAEEKAPPADALYDAAKRLKGKGTASEGRVRLAIRILPE
jgi:hypothetical protein